MTFGTEKLEWCGYPMVKKMEDTCICFDRVHERDGRTDGRTTRDGISRAGHHCRMTLVTLSDLCRADNVYIYI